MWSFTTAAASATLPAPWQTQDVGTVGPVAVRRMRAASSPCAGAGADIWDTADGFRYVYQSLSGDGQIIARVTSMQNTNAYAKAGVMIRESSTANAAHALIDAACRMGRSSSWLGRRPAGTTASAA